MAGMTKKAAVIDDDFARPRCDELQRYAHALRGFLSDNEAAKEWLDRQFGLAGDHRRTDYFDALFESQPEVLRFWNLRRECPGAAQLDAQVFAELAAEIDAARAPLRTIRGILERLGWVVQEFPALPATSDGLDSDLSLIVVDYILDRSQPASSVGGQFLRGYLAKGKDRNDFRCPFIVLMTALPTFNDTDVLAFRDAVDIQGAFFRFAPKTANGQVTGFEQAVVAFERLQPELECFRRFHQQMVGVATRAMQKLSSEIRKMQLQDLATLHAGQLVQEGEDLAEYLAWLYGQVVTAEFLRDSDLSKWAAEIPQSSHDVLLGHLPPTNGIPALFASFSLIQSASAARHRQTHGHWQVRAGDLFLTLPLKNSSVAADDSSAQPTPVAPGPYLLVISQDCDLLQSKITNGQVLCVEGHGSGLADTEVALLRATIRQMDNKGDLLFREADAYLQIAWETKNLRTLPIRTLSAEQGYRYLGRVNSIYALSAQHTVLDELTRIGVPLQPSYSMYFGSAELRVAGGQAPNLSSVFDRGVVVAVLRNEKGVSNKHVLLLAGELRDWLVTSLEAWRDSNEFPQRLAKPVDEFVNGIKRDPGYRLLVKADPKGAICTGTLIDAHGNARTEPLPPTIRFVFKDVYAPLSGDHQRVEIELRTI